MAFKNFVLSEDRASVIAEAMETVPSVIRTKKEMKSDIIDQKTKIGYIQNWPTEDLDDDFSLPQVTPDRLLAVTVKWRMKTEKLEFSRCLSSFYYPPMVPDIYNH